jgi:RNA polymerase sigma factor (sigma-70 family)
MTETKTVNIEQIASPPSNLSDKDIIARVKAGDNDAYGGILRRYNQRMFRIARSIVTDDALAMDIVQEAHIKAYTKLEEFRGSTEFFPWLATITRNEAFMYLRKYKREVTIEDDVLQFFEHAETYGKMNIKIGTKNELPDATLENIQLKNLIVKHIDKLPEDFRIVFVLRAVEQLSVKETAEILTIKEETVKTRYFRAKRILRSHLQKYFDAVGMQIYEFGDDRCDTVTKNVMSFISHSGDRKDNVNRNEIADNPADLKTLWLNLPSLNLTVKSLFTGYLLAIGLGAILASAQILFTHGMADGELGLSVDDIVYSYHGDPTHSKIETKLNGSMRDKASPADKLKIIKWVRSGAPEDQWQSDIKTVFYSNCVSCHSIIPGIPDFTAYENVKQVAKIDEGASTTSLTKVSHIHIFAISFIFFFNGLIFSLSVGIRQWVKVSVIALPFLFLVIDVFSWWLTKLSPDFAWLTIVSGIGYSLCSMITWLVSMYQMWILPLKGKEFAINSWAE